MESIGALEEVILMILIKKDKSHGVDIINEYESALGKRISLPAVHVVLKRLIKKGWVKSEFGEPTSERGGRRKRLYWASSNGYEVVKELQEAKMKLWNSITKPSYQYVGV